MNANELTGQGMFCPPNVLCYVRQKLAPQVASLGGDATPLLDGNVEGHMRHIPLLDSGPHRTSLVKA